MGPSFAPSRKIPEAKKIGQRYASIPYRGWRGVFYPQELPQKRELEYASQVFRSIEISGTFYSLQRPENFAAWVAAAPADFLFAVKFPRFVTHMRRLPPARNSDPNVTDVCRWSGPRYKSRGDRDWSYFQSP